MAWAAVGVASFQVISGMQQAETIRANAKISQQVANINAGYSDLDAYNATQAGVTRAARYQNVIDETIGAQKAAMAEKGQDVNFGTASQITTQTKITGMLNQIDMEQAANMKAMGYKNQAMNERLAGARAATEGALAAATTQNKALIEGATSVVSRYGRTPPTGSLDEQEIGGASGYHLGDYSFDEYK